MKLLDTDFCIEVLRGSPAAIEQMSSFGEAVCTSTISAAELFYGACRSARVDTNLAAVRTFLSDLPVVTLGASAAELYGRIRADLERQGLRLADADLMIGAIALDLDADLISGNVAHFRRIPGLRVQDFRPAASP